MLKDVKLLHEERKLLILSSVTDGSTLTGKIRNSQKMYSVQMRLNLQHKDPAL
jgi:hypothetical protein